MQEVLKIPVALTVSLPYELKFSVLKLTPVTTVQKKKKEMISIVRMLLSLIESSMPLSKNAVMATTVTQLRSEMFTSP